MGLTNLYHPSKLVLFQTRSNEHCAFLSPSHQNKMICCILGCSKSWFGTCWAFLRKLPLALIIIKEQIFGKSSSYNTAMRIVVPQIIPHSPLLVVHCIMDYYSHDDVLDISFHIPLIIFRRGYVLWFAMKSMSYIDSSLPNKVW